MIGLVIITHARLGRELVNAAEFILGRIDQVETVAVENAQDPDRLINALKTAINRVDDGDGVLVLTDMFGGTPNNISLALFEEGRVDVATGVNLPMVIKAATSRDGKTLAELGRMVVEAGQGSISVAGEILAS